MSARVSRRRVALWLYLNSTMSAVECAEVARCDYASLWKILPTHPPIERLTVDRVDRVATGCEVSRFGRLPDPEVQLRRVLPAYRPVHGRGECEFCGRRMALNPLTGVLRVHCDRNGRGCSGSRTEPSTRIETTQ